MNIEEYVMKLIDNKSTDISSIAIVLQNKLSEGEIYVSFPEVEQQSDAYEEEFKPTEMIININISGKTDEEIKVIEELKEKIEQELYERDILDTSIINVDEGKAL